MEIGVTLIRNAMTAGSSRGAYIGTRDEPLSDEGVLLLSLQKGTGRYPAVERVYTAPALRCRESASILYKGKPALVAEKLCTFDYEDFEGKTYQELEHEPAFQEWVRSADLRNAHMVIYQNVAAFREIMEECAEQEIHSVAIVTHRISMISIARYCCEPRLPYQEIPADFGATIRISYDVFRGVARLDKFF